MKYDSKADTLLHSKRVAQLLTEASSELIRRANVHDHSKLESPEKELFDEFTPKLKDCTYDLVKKFFADPKTTIEAFDFTVSMFAVDNEKIYHGETTFIDLAKRQLMINKITYPASTLSRAFRYYKKGFTMCLGEMKKLFEAIQNTPKEEPKQPHENQSEPKKEEEVSSGELGAFFIGID